MEQLLEDVRTGAFARAWAEEVARGRHTVTAAVARGAAHPIEQARRRVVGSDPGLEQEKPRKALSKN
jgi:ketol-acid reductoisomerase